MNCANCGEEVYFDITLFRWRHFGNQMTLFCDNRETFAVPNIDELKSAYPKENKAGVDTCKYYMGATYSSTTNEWIQWIHQNSKDKKCYLNSGNVLIAVPKEDESKTSTCKNCGIEIYFCQELKKWFHINKNPELSQITTYQECHLLFRDHINCIAEPKDDLIILDEVKTMPTDCITCDQIRYTKYPVVSENDSNIEDRAVCNFHRGIDHYLFLIRDYPASHKPPTWCPLKVKEPEKTYPIELKRRSLKDSLEFFIDKHDRGNLSTENLIEMIISRFENEPIKHPNAIGFDKCRNCGGTGHLKIHPGISGVVICPKCHGTGIQKKG